MKGFWGRRGLIAALAGMSVSALANAGIAPCVEDFPGIASLAFQGWSILNASNPLGPTSWHQGDPSQFPAAGGAADSYAAADSTSTIGAPSLVSVWLVTPTSISDPTSSTRSRSPSRRVRCPAERIGSSCGNARSRQTEACEPPACQGDRRIRSRADRHQSGPARRRLSVHVDDVHGEGACRRAPHVRARAHRIPLHADVGTRRQPRQHDRGIDTVTIAGATSCPFSDTVFFSNFE